MFQTSDSQFPRMYRCITKSSLSPKDQVSFQAGQNRDQEFPPSGPDDVCWKTWNDTQCQSVRFTLNQWTFFDCQYFWVCRDQISIFWMSKLSSDRSLVWIFQTRHKFTMTTELFQNSVVRCLWLYSGEKEEPGFIVAAEVAGGKLFGSDLEGDTRSLQVLKFSPFTVKTRWVSRKALACQEQTISRREGCLPWAQRFIRHSKKKNQVKVFRIKQAEMGVISIGLQIFRELGLSMFE